MPRPPRARGSGIAACRGGSRVARLGARAAGGPALGRVKLARLALGSGTVTFGDEGVAPAREGARGRDGRRCGFSTSPTIRGQARVRAQVTARPGPKARDARHRRRLRLAGAARGIGVRVDGFALATVRPTGGRSQVSPSRQEGAVALGPRGRRRADGDGRWPTAPWRPARAPRRAPGGSARAPAVPPDSQAHRRTPRRRTRVVQTAALGAIEVGGADLRSRARSRAAAHRSLGLAPATGARDRGGQGADGARWRLPPPGPSRATAPRGGAMEAQPGSVHLRQGHPHVRGQRDLTGRPHAGRRDDRGSASGVALCETGAISRSRPRCRVAGEPTGRGPPCWSR